MCGRYVLAMRAWEIRHQLEDYDLPANSAPDDDEVRQTYNFAPSSRGLVYRADTSDRGGGTQPEEDKENNVETEAQPNSTAASQKSYKLQAMRWGLIPFWTKRAPDYSSQMKTINCRDDSLIENRGMWTSMKKHKRCIVIAQGFYEWLKKNNGKEKIPHYIKREDGQLMLMAGLWDCVQYEDSNEKIYSYSIITTGSNKQMSFLHDRMPVILEPKSEALSAWLDPDRSEWSSELQSILTPFSGKLEIYPVAKEVGKVGNNSPTFIVPIDSKENKNNIANFFTNGKGSKEIKSNNKGLIEKEPALKGSNEARHEVGNEDDETKTKYESGSEDNAPLPVAELKYQDQASKKIKREHSDDEQIKSPPHKAQRTSPKKRISKSPSTSTRKTRSATSNGSTKKPTLTGTPKITSFFSK